MSQGSNMRQTVLRNFYRFDDGLELDDRLNPVRRVSLDPAAAVPGFFVEQGEVHWVLATPQGALLLVRDHMVRIDDSVTLRLQGEGARRILEVRNGEQLVLTAAAPEPVQVTDDPYGMDDFYAWLVGRFVAADRRAAFSALAAAG